MTGSTSDAAPLADRTSLVKFAWLSVGAAVLTIAMKTGAWLVTGSVGLLSDALESVVNLVAAMVALFALRLAAKPADASHHFGHGKAEYFSAAVEGVMIFVAAALILWAAAGRLLNPEPLDDVGIGLAITLAATAVNGSVGLALIRVGRRHRSITLVADGKHLMTDVWTSLGVVVGVTAVALTGWLRLDPLIAIAVGVNILVTGSRLVRDSSAGLMDAALPADEERSIETALDRFRSDEVTFHALQTRQAGHQRFISVHVLVPGAWTVQQGHDLLEEVEHAVREALPDSTVHTHLEPREDPRAFEDAGLGAVLPPAELPAAELPAAELPAAEQEPSR